MKLKEKFKSWPMEAIGNWILIAALTCAFTATVACALLDHFHIFYLNISITLEMIIITVLFAFLLSIYALYIITKGEILLKSWFKYYLLTVMFIWLAVNCSVVYFHSVILVLFPLFISRCYDSKRIVRLSIAETLLLIIATPLIAYAIGGMDRTFPLWYVQLLIPEAISEYGREYWRSASQFAGGLSETSPYVQLLIWVSLPRILIAVSIIIISVVGSHTGRSNNKRQIKKILKLQDSIIDSMAEVIENRDSSTGGHVKRTQDYVRILTKYISMEIDMPNIYWGNIIKSAAMHDLGKIAVSDLILNKPGKLTAEEFEEIKKHPEKSKSIIDTVLARIDDKELLKIADNVALYHHEKYNGEGYPSHLKGDEIPLEARIMAIADVFDALVSVRCYKEPYSTQEAYDIIKESMGTHFDPKLWNAFDKAFKELEQYSMM